MPAAKADQLPAIYERVVVAGPEIIGVRLTHAAHAQLSRVQHLSGAP